MHEDQEVSSGNDNSDQLTQETAASEQGDNYVNVESRTLFYQDHTFQNDQLPAAQNETAAEITSRHAWKDDIIDFITGIFWILESKRREEAQRENRQERMALLSRSGLVNLLNIILYINETKLNEL